MGVRPSKRVSHQSDPRTLVISNIGKLRCSKRFATRHYFVLVFSKRMIYTHGWACKGGENNDRRLAGETIIHSESATGESQMPMSKDAKTRKAFKMLGGVLVVGLFVTQPGRGRTACRSIPLPTKPLFQQTLSSCLHTSAQR